MRVIYRELVYDKDKNKFIYKDTEEEMPDNPHLDYSGPQVKVVYRDRYLERLWNETYCNFEKNKKEVKNNNKIEKMKKYICRYEYDGKADTCGIYAKNITSALNLIKMFGSDCKIISIQEDC